MDLPKVLRIEPSSACNLRCLHCPTGTINMKREKMSNDVEDKTIEIVKKYHEFFKVVVLYHGGEPFLNTRFVKQIKSIIPF